MSYDLGSETPRATPRADDTTFAMTMDHVADQPTAEGNELPPTSLLNETQVQRANIQIAHHRRRYARVPYHLKVTVYSEETFIAGIVWNLSQGGAFIITGRPFDVDTRVDFECDLPDGRVRLGGRVAWRRFGAFGDQEPPPGMGVQFEDLHPHVVMALRSFTLQRMEDLGYPS